MRIRELRDGQEVQEDEREAEARGGGYEVAAVVRLKAKRALVGAGARVLFYPTLLYNVVRNRFEAEFRWWDRVDQVLLFYQSPPPSPRNCVSVLDVIRRLMNIADSCIAVLLVLFAAILGFQPLVHQRCRIRLLLTLILLRTDSIIRKNLNCACEGRPF